MFNTASSFNQPLDDWDTSKVESFYVRGRANEAAPPERSAFRPRTTCHSLARGRAQTMFQNAISFNQPLHWDSSSVTSMYVSGRPDGDSPSPRLSAPRASHTPTAPAIHTL